MGNHDGHHHLDLRRHLDILQQNCNDTNNEATVQRSHHRSLDCIGSRGGE